jgi:RNA polymerase primary sigma factor
LTREGEVEIAKRIEAGELAVFQAILRCPIGLAELGRIREALRSGALAAKDATRNAGDEGPDWEAAEQRRVTRLLSSVIRLAGRGDVAAGPSLQRRTRQRAENQQKMLDALVDMRLKKKVIDSIVDRLHGRIEERERALRARLGRARPIDREVRQLRAACATIAEGARLSRYARAELVRANLRLVISIAKRHANRGLMLGDLIQ